MSKLPFGLDPDNKKYYEPLTAILPTGSTVFIEIRSTHEADKEKLQKLMKYQIPTLEIDIRPNFEEIKSFKDLIRQGLQPSLRHFAGIRAEALLMLLLRAM